VLAGDRFKRSRAESTWLAGEFSGVVGCKRHQGRLPRYLATAN
jgi:hypothetical protein